MEQILTALVGSQAHGLAEPTSDADYRGIFITPTSDLLALGSQPTRTLWKEGAEDDVSWEIGHFLFLATKCNPSILETLVSPSYTANAWGEELRALFPALWNSVGVRAAFCGYGWNQRKKFLDDKDQRRSKYATAYLRTLYNAWNLLSTGTFRLDVRGTEIEATCRRFRAGDYTVGEVIDTCATWEAKVNEAYTQYPDKQTDLDAVNDFLLRARKEHWA